MRNMRRHLLAARARGRAGFASAAGPHWTSTYQATIQDGAAAATAVSGPAFTELLRKCGLSKKQLHALYPAHDGALPRSSGQFTRL